MKCTVYIAASLDGFIARKDGGLDWLPVPTAEDYGYGEFMKSVDTVVMGRNTFDVALTFGDWPYEKNVIVLTSRPASLPNPLPPRVRASSGQPQDIVADLQRAGAEHLYVDGGATIQQFLRAGCISHMIITTVPVLLGDGVPLFGTLTHEIRLRQARTAAFANGLVQSEYLITA